MDGLERAALKHAAEWLRYSRSPQARHDAEQDRKARIQADKKSGHTPMCGLMECHPSCTHQRNS